MNLLFATTRRGPLSRAVVSIGVAAALLAFRTPAAHAATALEVETAIQNAKAYLYSQEHDDNWEPPGPAYMFQDGGHTALATYALLAAGESPNDPRIRKAIHYLLNCKMDGVYAIGFRAQVWSLLPQPYKPEVRAAIAADGAALLRAAHPDNLFPVPGGFDPNFRIPPALLEAARARAGNNLGQRPSAFYRYKLDSKDWDHSVSQYGVLGMWACVQSNFEAPTAYWKTVDAGWRSHQYPDGGWSYQGIGSAAANNGSRIGASGPMDESATMTAAGIATLFITQEYLHEMDGIECHGNTVDPNIDAGLNWMAEHFNEIFRDVGGHECYGLYGVERIGAASGRKYFGTIDWYKQGADYFAHHVFRGPGGADVYNTAFALLFLVRGRAPVVMNKLQYDLNVAGQPAHEANWNQRPRDVANLTKWIGKQDELTLNWQVVNLDVPVEDLHDAPILYIAGNQALDFTAEQLAKLRQFVEEGGMIVANSDCGSPAFTESLVKVCHELFPLYEFRNLPTQSPIYNNEQFNRSRWRSPMRVDALSNGVRELVITFPANDPARFWQIQFDGGNPEMFELANDIYLFSTDRGAGGGFRNKGDTYIVTADPQIRATRRLNVARLEFSGNWDPEPGAWRRLAAILHNTQRIDLDVQSIKLGEGKLDRSFPLAHLTGTYQFTLTDAQREEIRNYVQGGGTLIVDSAGGGQAFALSAETELGSIFPNAKPAPTPLPLTDPAFSRGPKLDQVEYRRYAKAVLGNLRTPRIRAMQVNGRSAVYFSGEDLTCGMLGMQVDGIYGYDPASATALMEKLVLSVLPDLPVATAVRPDVTGGPASRPATDAPPPIPGRTERQARREELLQAEIPAEIEALKSGSISKQLHAADRLARAVPEDRSRADVLAALEPLLKDAAGRSWSACASAYCRWADAAHVDTVKSILAASDDRTGFQKDETAAAACAALFRMDVPAAVDATNARIENGMFRLHVASDLQRMPDYSLGANDIANQVVDQLRHHRLGMKITVNK